jgi:hypothetical protein
MADHHDRPVDPGHRLDHRPGVVVKRRRRVRARQVDGDPTVTERLEQGNHRRQLGGAAERTVDENERRHLDHLCNSVFSSVG